MAPDKNIELLMAAAASMRAMFKSIDRMEEYRVLNFIELDELDELPTEARPVVALLFKERERCSEAVVDAFRALVDGYRDGGATRVRPLDTLFPATMETWKEHRALIESTEPDLETTSFPKDETDERGLAVFLLVWSLASEMAELGVFGVFQKGWRHVALDDTVQPHTRSRRRDAASRKRRSARQRGEAV